jgi:DNA polymerase III delta subunit
VKFYDFIDKAPAIGRLVIVEGTEPLFAQRAIAAVVDRILDPAVRDLNRDTFVGPELDGVAAVADATAAMPFMGTSRLIVVRQTEDMRAAPRRALWDVAQSVPEGNTLLLEDLQPPTKRTKPETFGQLAGRAGLRIDVTAGGDARARFAKETLAELGATAEPRVIAAIANSDAPLLSVRTDLEKLAIAGTRITLEALMGESIAAEDPRAYEAASALVSGDSERALSLAAEMIAAGGDRGAAVPLLSAIASEYRLIWELARPGGEVPARFRWRERVLRPIAQRLGERRARLGYERAVRGFEAIVTGRADDLRTIVALLTAAASGGTQGRERRGPRTTGPS